MMPPRALAKMAETCGLRRSSVQSRAAAVAVLHGAHYIAVSAARPRLAVPQ